MPQLFNHGHGWETLEQIQAREAREKEEVVSNEPVEAKNEAPEPLNEEKVLDTTSPEKPEKKAKKATKKLK